MNDAASFDAIMQCNLLEVFCEALDAAIFVTDRLDELSFASVRLLHLFPIEQGAIAPGTRARDLYGALFDAGCRFGASGGHKDRKREDWIAERVAGGWKERTDTIEQSGPDRWFHIVSRRFSSGLGLTVIQDVSGHKRKETQWNIDRERVRTTEEILDMLPVAVAVKDRNLNFAAVNQQFCKMLGTVPDAMLGHGVWDIFEPKLAKSLEEADWHLLATGEDRESVIQINHPDAGPTVFLHRARRVGKPGNHYIALSFDEFPVDETLSRAVADLSLQVGGSEGVAAMSGGRSNLLLGDKKLEKLYKVVYVHTGAGGSSIVAEAAHRGIELCIIRGVNEFTAFLPAIEAAGIELDLVVIEPNADFVFATLSAKYGIRHRMLSPGANVMESIIDAFERHSRPLPAPTMDASPAIQELPSGAKSADIDILAIEDNPVNRLVIEQILESLGLNFDVAATGGEALGKIAGCRPQIVLVDITLPDMDIDVFMQRLELAMQESGIRPPVIGLTSGDSSELRRSWKEAGLVDTVAKPLSPEAIDRVLRKHLLHEASADSLPPKSIA